MELANILEMTDDPNPISLFSELLTVIRKLWADPGIQKCFMRSHEYQLIDSASYFFGRMADILQKDYRPSITDILRTRIVTVGVSEIAFEIR